jgi:hypothetical protein
MHRHPDILNPVNPVNPVKPDRVASGRRRWLLAGAAAVVGLPLRPGFDTPVIDPASVPEPRRTKAGRYLLAADGPAFIQAQGGEGRVLFLDPCPRAKAMCVGMAAGIDALMPHVEHQELMTDWDARRGLSRPEPMQDFVPEAHRRLAADGWTQVWSVVDGFEGDMSKDGRRDVHGWKNAGRPSTCKLDRSRMHFPR